MIEEILRVSMLSPIGRITISGDDQVVRAIAFDEIDYAEAEDPPAPLIECQNQLAAYFNGECKSFNISWAAKGSLFQQKIWKLLEQIPYGHTVSYAQLARQLGNDAAVRAVGMANSKNPLAILIPCHRVIGKEGQLIGYAGGLWRKKWLIEHESRAVQTSLF